MKDSPQREWDHHPIRMFAHALTVIVGRGDLLSSNRSEAERTKHLEAIRETAKSTAEKPNSQQCHLSGLARDAPC